MREAFYDRTRQYDKFLGGVIQAARKSCTEFDDDFGLLIVGATGSGKSSLALHIYEACDPEGCNVKFIGLDRNSFANAMKDAKDKATGWRITINDEANINKRDALTTYNKDILDLYLANRGLNMFWMWCNPSADMIDKPFLKERIKGVIFVFTKNSDGKPRLYYYFHVADLLKLWERYKDISFQSLKKGASAFATYRGWFREYKGKLWKDYMTKKAGRMSFKVDDFFEKYGGQLNKKTINKTNVTKALGLHRDWINRHFNRMYKEGVLIEGEDFFIDAIGRKKYYNSAIDKIKEYAKQFSVLKGDGLLYNRVVDMGGLKKRWEGHKKGSGVNSKNKEEETIG